MPQQLHPLAYLEALSEIDPKSAFWAVDAEQNITFWSKGAETMLGYKGQDVVGKHCSIAIRCVRCSTGCGLRNRGLIQDKALLHFHREGKEVVTIKSAKAFHDDAGNFLGGVEILRLSDKPASDRAKQEVTDFFGIITGDPSFVALLTSLRHVAHTDVNVLIRGETGTGKEMVAKAIHQMSPRASKPFIAVNCGTLSREFLASEIFGHKRGAFTGAVADKKGLLARAEGGTLFLDEVAELPPDVQAMLLRVIQERRYTPLGDIRDQKADIRIISATHASLRQAVADGRFREDLMYRLRVVPVFLPPLSQRKGDVLLLLHHALKAAAKKMKVPAPVMTQEAFSYLDHYPWPGNIRELFNLADYLTVTRSGKDVGVDHLLPEFRETPPVPTPGQTSKTGPTRETVEDALLRANGSMDEAAKLLGISRITLWRWRKKLGLTETS